MMVEITNGTRPAVVEEILKGTDLVVDVDGQIFENDDGEMLTEVWTIVTQDIDMMLTNVYMVSRHAGEPFKVKRMAFTPRDLAVMCKAAETWK